MSASDIAIITVQIQDIDEGEEPTPLGTDLSVNDLSVYPNPAYDGIVTIKNDRVINALEIFDHSGRRVLQLSGLSRDSLELDLKELTPGIYYLAVSDNSGQKIKKLVIK